MDLEARLAPRFGRPTKDPGLPGDSKETLSDLFLNPESKTWHFFNAVYFFACNSRMKQYDTVSFTENLGCVINTGKKCKPLVRTVEIQENDCPELIYRLKGSV